MLHPQSQSKRMLVFLQTCSLHWSNIYWMTKCSANATSFYGVSKFFSWLQNSMTSFHSLFFFVYMVLNAGCIAQWLATIMFGNQRFLVQVKLFMCRDELSACTRIISKCLWIGWVGRSLKDSLHFPCCVL